MKTQPLGKAMPIHRSVFMSLLLLVIGGEVGVVNAVETTGRSGGGGYYGYGYGYGAGEYLAENGKPQGVAKRWLSRLPFSGKEG